MFRLFRGVLLVVIGIVIGVVVLANTLERADDESDTVASGETASTTVPAATPAASPTTIPRQPAVTNAPASPATTPAAPTTILEPEALPPEQVRVQVFNGTDTQGAAGRLTTTLAAANYVTLPPQNAPEERDYTTSSIYFSTPDYLANAGHVAILLNVTNPGVIQQLPNPSPVVHDRAHVIVVIGADGLAS